MKYIKTVLIIIGIIIAIPFIPAFGTCMFLGFLILGGLDLLGIIKIKTDNFNVIALLSAVIGAVFFGIYYLITGHL